MDNLEIKRLIVVGLHNIYYKTFLIFE